MADTYPYLLKNVSQKQFGIKPADLVVLNKKGKAVKKLVVVYNGEKYEPVNCKEVSVQFQDDTITLNIVLADDKPQPEESPVTDAVMSTTKDEIFLLKGDDLEAFTALSEFRNNENQNSPTEVTKREAHILESEIYDIQDLQSVQSAILDLVGAEKKFLENDYIVLKYSPPRFAYEEDESHFKLIESVVLCKKEAATISKDTEN